MDDFSRSGNVSATDQLTLLESVAAVLRATTFNDASLFNASNCFIASAATPSIEIQSNLCCTIKAGPGRFDADSITGGGMFGVHETSRLEVTIWSRIALDVLDRSDIAFFDARRGLLPIKRAVLAALAGQQLYADYPATTIPLLTKYLTPIDSQTAEFPQNEHGWTSVTITFDAPFYWDLTGIESTPIDSAGSHSGGSQGSGGSTGQFATETPAGAVDGTNRVFTIAQSPVANSLLLFVNGQLQPHAYNLIANTLTFGIADVPQTGDILTAWYQY